MSRFLEGFRMAGGDVKGVMDRFVEDEDLFRECLQQFVEEDGFDKLKASIEAENYKEAFEHAHAIKGVTGNLGIMPVYNRMCNLVESLRYDKLENVSAELEEVLNAYADFLEKYKEMI